MKLHEVRSGSDLFKWYNDLPGYARAIVVIGTGIVVIGTVVSVINAIKAASNAKKSAAEVLGFVNDLNTLTTAGSKPSFQQSQYQQWADAITQQFTGCDFSTSSLFADLTNVDDASNASNYSSAGAYVLGIITQFKNNSDFLALEIAFGTRTISKHWYCGGDDSNVTLSAAISDQLDGAEVTALNTVLKSQGITYTF